MSHSGVAAAATQPLSDILPWGPPITVEHRRIEDLKSHRDIKRGNNSDNGSSIAKNALHYAQSRALLITDSCSTDGRFLLHALASQFLSCRYCDSSSSSLLSSKPHSGRAAGRGGSNNVNSTATDSSHALDPVLEGSVVWISCGPATEKQIYTALRKASQAGLGSASSVGSAAAPGTGRAGASVSIGGSKEAASRNFSRLKIISVPMELADSILQQSNDDKECGDENILRDSFSHEVYLKDLYQRITQFTRQNKGPNLVVMENATTFAALLGDALAHMFLSSLRASLGQTSQKYPADAFPGMSKYPKGPNEVVTSTNLLVIRCNSPDDGGLYQEDSTVTSGSGGEQQLRSEHSRLLRPWVGMGSGTHDMDDFNGDDMENIAALDSITQLEEQSTYLSLHNSSSPPFIYKSGLYEMVDGIVDVSPLESGYARDVLGRLSFATTWSGMGWWGITTSACESHSKRSTDLGTKYVSVCVNYRCDDSGARVMRLRTQ